MSEKIYKKNIVDSYEEDMVRYAIAVDIARAIPEVKDGQKPVQRRNIFTMFNDEHCVSLATKKKCAKIVGTCMGSYHPRGDSSIYGALVNLANWYQMKMPIVNGYGNFGSIGGDGAAAMRYTEAYLSPFAMDHVINTLKETNAVVDWSPNFDDSIMEPDYLPVNVPILLINGTFGIGVGIQTYIPPHNLNEVIDATINLIRHPNADVVLIPDMCMPCHIVNTNWKKICNTGHGKFVARAHIEIGEHLGDPALIVTALPDNVSALNVRSKILEIIEAGQLPMIKNVLVSSKNDSLKMTIALNKGADPNYVKEVLYKRTDLEKDFTVNFEVVNDIEPVRMSYKSYLEYFINFQKYLKLRYVHSKLQKVLTEYHRKDAYIKILQSGEVDKVIAMIRNSKESNEAELVEYLVKKIKVTDLQAKFILRTQIQNLSKGNLGRYIQEAEELMKQKVYYESLITDENRIKESIIEDLQAAKKKYGSPRKCDIIEASTDLIPDGVFNIVITENNFIRKIGENEYANIVRGDKPKFALKVRNTESILIFDNKGRVFKMPVHKIALCDKTNPGVDLRLSIKGFTSDVISVIYEPVIHDLSKNRLKHYITVVTEGNYIKKMDLDDFLNVPLSGIVYSKLKPGDSVKDIELLPDKLDVIVYNHHKALRFMTKDIGHYKRITQGDYAMKTTEPLEGLSVVYPDAQYIVVITHNGKINKFNIEGLARSNRYKAGTNVIKLDKTDSITTIYGVKENDIILAWSGDGQTSIKVSDIPLGSSISKGVKMIPTKSSGVIKTQVIQETM